MDPIKLSREQIKELVPHREPMFLVDEIIALVPGEYCIGSFYVDPEMEILKGHFPGDPTLPGVYTLEFSGQSANLMMATMPEYAGKVQLFLGINSARFYKKIRPGDTMVSHARMLNNRKDKAIVTIEHKVYVNDELAMEAETAVALR
jgi:3-hydroxyacyl-[acyl-carrier-protein] dehydratase